MSFILICELRANAIFTKTNFKYSKSPNTGPLGEKQNGAVLRVARYSDPVLGVLQYTEKKRGNEGGTVFGGTRFWGAGIRGAGIRGAGRGIQVELLINNY